MAKAEGVFNASKIINSKWKIPILFHLINSKKRYRELKRLLPGINDQMLTKELKELQKFTLVNREVYEIIPPKVEYSITDFGTALKDLINSFEAFGNKNSLQINKVIEKL